MSKKNNKRWADTGYLRAKPETVSVDEGIISGVKVCSAGEAKGHGVHLDSEFIEEVAKQGAALQKGLKARFGHPNMCSDALGTFVGRFHNFSVGETVREDGTKAACCYADLHLSETAQNTPNGDLFRYILEMAEKEDDVFGTSIVFQRGKIYRRDKKGEKVYPVDEDGYSNVAFQGLKGPDFIECAKLMACDCVDEPAANDGLFSAFSADMVAAQITEFFDLHPHVFRVLEDNPAIMEAIALHGSRFEEFYTRYIEYRGNNKSQHETHCDNTKGATMPDKKKDLIEETGDEAGKVEASEEMKEEVVQASTETVKEEAKVDTKAEIQEALKADRQRMKEIRELGEKFGFTDSANQFADEGKSVDEFRKHILGKSPEDWKASLQVKNPRNQETEEDIDSFEEGQSLVEKIKKQRRA